MNEKKHLPMYGVGPIYVLICVTLTIVGVILTKMDLLATGNIEQCRLLC